jgi:DNA-binding transcriptional regulator YhcF (GntR family)
MEEEKFKVSDESGDRKYFTIIPNYIVNHSTPYEQAIYLFMKRIAGEGGTCWSSAAEIGKKLGCSRNTVAKYQNKLIERGWIEVVGKHPTGVTNQETIEYKIVDLWALNNRYFQDKYKSSTYERLPRSSTGEREAFNCWAQRRTYK